MKSADRSHIDEMHAESRSSPPPAPRIYRVDLGTQATYEAGALLLTLLAFPKETADDRALAELHAALCTAALIERSRTDVEWSLARQAIKPVHFSVARDVVKKRMRTFERALRDRMIAGRVANAIIFDAAGLNPTLPKGCEGFAIKQLIKMALDDLGQADAENAEHRVWRATLPAVHLAAAVQAYLNRPDKADFEVSWGDIIFDPEAIAWIAERAMLTWRLMLDRPERFALGKQRPILIQTSVSDFKKIVTS